MEYIAPIRELNGKWATKHLPNASYTNYHLLYPNIHSPTWFQAGIHPNKLRPFFECRCYRLDPYETNRNDFPYYSKVSPKNTNNHYFLPSCIDDSQIFGIIHSEVRNGIYHITTAPSTHIRQTTGNKTTSVTLRKDLIKIVIPRRGGSVERNLWTEFENKQAKRLNNSLQNTPCMLKRVQELTNSHGST